MKKNLFSLLILLNFAVSLVSENLKEIWTIENLDCPESIVYYEDKNVFFVSNINGDPTEKDRNGYISIIDAKGKVINKKWIATLDAPKGMAIFHNFLYVADIDQLVIIDINKEMIINRIPFPEAEFLNDVACDENGKIYISDSSSNPGIIYQYFNNSYITWIKSKQIKRPNGLYYYENNLYIGSFANGNLFTANIKNKKIEKIGHFINAIDGLAVKDSTTFFLSNWFNKVVIVKNYTKESEIKFSNNCADIFYYKKDEMLLVPTFFNNKVIAYKIIQ